MLEFKARPTVKTIDFKLFNMIQPVIDHGSMYHDVDAVP